VRPRFVGVRDAHCQPASGPEKLVILTRLYPFAYCKLGKMKTRTITRCSVLYKPFVGFDIGTPRTFELCVFIPRYPRALGMGSGDRKEQADRDERERPGVAAHGRPSPCARGGRRPLRLLRSDEFGVHSDAE